VVTAVAPTPSIQCLFDGLAPPEVIEAYDRLLARNGCAESDAETMLGAALVGALTERGMAHIQPHTPTDPVWLQPTTPDLALQGILAGHQSQLAADHQRLIDGHERLAVAQAHFGIGMNGYFPEHLVAVISDPAEISNLSASLINTARRDWMTLEDLRTDMPLTTDYAQPPLPATLGRVRCRSIYPAAAMDDPITRHIIQACTEAGEQARLLPQVPMKMKLADHATAMLPLTPTGTAGALVVHAPVILAALREYFELLWDKATPVGPPPAVEAGDRPPPQQLTILQLMAEGLNDDAIASRTGLSVTTVRRHITAVLKRLNVTGRFAAGAAAHRRGWIQ
jgi:DNA-binding CsgD family transcriptional regulator